MFTELTTQQAIDEFMQSVYNFHDSCIKEMKYISGAYVNENLGMYPVNDKRILSVLIQRQYKNPFAVELEFSGLKYLKLNPLDEKYSCDIFGASMFISDGLIYWCDCEDLTINDINDCKGTVICANSVRYRLLDKLGSDEVYVIAE